MKQALTRHAMWLLFATQAATAYAADERLMLWEIRGARSSVYLYGSVHVCRPECYPLDRTVLQHFDASPVLAVELDPARADTRSKLMSAALLPTRERLSERLAPEDRAMLSSVLESLGISEAVIDTYQPWMVTTLIAVMSAQRLGYEASLGVDVWLMQRAASQGKPVVELETVERQIRALSGGSTSEQLDALKRSLGMVRDGRSASYLADLVSAWRSGNIQRIGELTLEGTPADSSLIAGLLDERNVEMVQRLDRWLRDGQQAFVAIGAAHMSGPNGIPALLRKRGYKVQQLRDAP